ncbi:erythromycin esterase family protein [Aureispira anguillae]|uniref:Erythromycin esterase family protein n=1 Tax=Aureispira anguillae TaxID=2864201 RepID=A0A915YDY6_9BACT|nr:erythromycin esterase family protein [Aureispira anguillae]BDS11251.1 erythromycin esterase family protein [Aureispira anguillae]
MQPTLILILSLFLSFNLVSQHKNFLKKPVVIHKELDHKEQWRFLTTAIGDKKIVCLGESLHGIKDHNACKLELIKYLHEEMGFNVLAIESDLAKSYIGNLYRDQIPDLLFLEKVFSPVWHTEKHLELVRYIKSHPKLQLIGFDIEGKVPIATIFEDFGIPLDTTTPPIQNFLKHYADFRDPYGTAQPFIDYYRDSVMAQIAQWIIKDEYSGEKVILSGANAHISKVEVPESMAYMGEMLFHEFKEDYYAIGLYHSLGNPTHLFRDLYYVNQEALLPKKSLQFQLLKLKKDYLFLELHLLAKKNKFKWVKDEVLDVMQTQKYQQKVNLKQSFDAVIWIKEVTHPIYVIDSKYHYKNRR